MLAAAEPVVRRWIARELSPAATLRSLAVEARAALSALPRLAEALDAPAQERPAEKPAATRPGLAFALGALCAALAFALAVWLR
jgi:ubiquinone biosynthesis protein